MFKNKTILTEIAANHPFHSCSTEWYKSFSDAIAKEVLLGHSPRINGTIQFGEVGIVDFPFYAMGNVDSSNLFGLDELILFSFYFQNKSKYKKVLDLGANIGLHTLVLTLLGYSVVSYEPDPIHVAQIRKVLEKNKVFSGGIVEAAVSDSNAMQDFVRVLGNTTGSHLLGAKSSSPYGGHETFSVKTHDIGEVLEAGFDLVKMDVEGHEATLISHLSPECYQKTDFLLEVGSKENASKIYQRINNLGLNMFAQKMNWQKVENESDVPTSYKEGSLFITRSAEMQWIG